MKCAIKWIDQNGKPTPDENEAVSLAHFHKCVIKPSTTAKVESHYLQAIAHTFPICGEHLKQVRPEMLYENGGGWTIGPLPK